MSDVETAWTEWSENGDPSDDEQSFKAGFAAGERSTQSAKDKSALDLMRSLSINPAIPEGFRTMMKESLDR